MNIRLCLVACAGLFCAIYAIDHFELECTSMAEPNFYHDGRCYALESNPLAFDDAQQACTRLRYGAMSPMSGQAAVDRMALLWSLGWPENEPIMISGGAAHTPHGDSGWAYFFRGAHQGDWPSKAQGWIKWYPSAPPFAGAGAACLGLFKNGTGFGVVDIDCNTQHKFFCEYRSGVQDYLEDRELNEMSVQASALLSSHTNTDLPTCCEMCTRNFICHEITHSFSNECRLHLTDHTDKQSNLTEPAPGFRWFKQHYEQA